jgi:hypothetical protein
VTTAELSPDGVTVTSSVSLSKFRTTCDDDDPTFGFALTRVVRPPLSARVTIASPFSSTLVVFTSTLKLTVSPGKSTVRPFERPSRWSCTIAPGMSETTTPSAVPADRPSGPVTNKSAVPFPIGTTLTRTFPPPAPPKLTFSATLRDVIGVRSIVPFSPNHSDPGSSGLGEAFS